MKEIGRMGNLQHIFKTETADVAKLEEIRKLLTSVRIIAPVGALQKKVINSILIRLERADIYSKISVQR